MQVESPSFKSRRRVDTAIVHKNKGVRIIKPQENMWIEKTKAFHKTGMLVRHKSSYDVQEREEDLLTQTEELKWQVRVDKENKVDL